MGYTHASVTALYGLLAVASAAGGLAYYGGSEAVATAALLLVAALHVALAVGVTALEAARRRAPGGRTAAV
ncbi:MAG: hypothetical protein M5R40_14310 [Anaerolineae bacterium]|nr:hypothetical protein [Anaerolineae bacterium]